MSAVDLGLILSTIIILTILTIMLLTIERMQQLVTTHASRIMTLESIVEMREQIIKRQDNMTLRYAVHEALHNAQQNGHFTDPKLTEVEMIVHDLLSCDSDIEDADPDELRAIVEEWVRERLPKPT